MSRPQAEFRPDLLSRYRLRAGLDLGQRLACGLRVGEVLQQLADLCGSQVLQLGRQFGRDDRGEPLAVLGEVDDLTARSVMRRVGDLARCLL
jgi:hypothetical protein